MDLSGLSSAAPVRMKAFPPGRRGVLLPLDDRRTAALGICLYTASKPWVVALQKAAHLLVTLAGARALPGRAELWQPPCNGEEWQSLVASWHNVLGAFDGLTLYRRRQQARPGHTLLLTRQGDALALVKLRTDGADALDVEQAALAAVSRFRPRTFRAPRPLGAGGVGRLRWSAQEAVFSAPHQPVLRTSPELFDEVAACLVDLASPRPPGADHPEDSDSDLVTAHGDLTPWNLRRDRLGQVWLYDWEDVGPAPLDSDRAYFCATARPLGGAPMPGDLPVEGVEHCRRVIRERNSSNPEDAELMRCLMEALDEADGARRRVGDTRPSI